MSFRSHFVHGESSGCKDLISKIGTRIILVRACLGFRWYNSERSDVVGGLSTSILFSSGACGRSFAEVSPGVEMELLSMQRKFGPDEGNEHWAMALFGFHTLGGRWWAEATAIFFSASLPESL